MATIVISGCWQLFETYYVASVEFSDFFHIHYEIWRRVTNISLIYLRRIPPKFDCLYNLNNHSLYLYDGTIEKVITVILFQKHINTDVFQWSLFSDGLYW